MVEQASPTRQPIRPSPGTGDGVVQAAARSASANLATPFAGRVGALADSAVALNRGPHVATLQRVAATLARPAVDAPAEPNRTGLPDGLKTGVESLSGLSMDHVRVHYDSARPAQLGAHAFAQGSDIHVAPGQERHVPHEAWHVVQQAQGRVRPTLQMKDGAAINDDRALEHEADVMGAHAARATAQRRAIGQSVSMLRATAQFSGTVTQRVQIDALLGDADTAEEIVAQLGGLIVNQPGDDEAEQQEFAAAIEQAAGYWQRVGASDIGETAGDRRLGLLAALHAADAPNGLQRLVRYYFNLGGRPHEAPRGIGTLALLRGPTGGVVGIDGRPGLFAIRTGGASQARRHITAWHTLRAVMNQIIARFDAHDLAEISRLIVEVADPGIAEQAATIALREAGQDGVEFRIIWLAVVLNNIPHNLWLGAARENISINTLAGFIVRWTDELRDQAITMEVYRDRLQRYNAGSPMARNVIRQLLHEIAQPHVTELGGDARRAVWEIVQREIRPQLEIDPRRHQGVSDLQLFLYEAGEGAVVINDIDHIGRALLAFVEAPGEGEDGGAADVHQ